MFLVVAVVGYLAASSAEGV